MTDIDARAAEDATRTSHLALELRGISKEFSGVVALRDVSLRVAAGEVHALLGENGAGKSTLMNVATGALAADEGVIVVDGREVASLTPADATRAGIAIVHQHPAVLPDLTVLENLQVALPASVFAGRSTTERAKELLAAVDLSVPLWTRVEDLSVARKHLLEIAKALAVEPRVLILDEPTAPLDSDSTELLFNLVRRAVAAGTAVVYITHRLAEVRDLADTVTVLRDGRLRATARVSDVTDDELLSLIVGRQLESTFPPKLGAEADQTVLSATGLTGDGFTDVSFEARRGEIVGIAGVVGNGQTELMRALAGLQSFAGAVELSGGAVSSHKLISAASYMPADRHREGLMMEMTVGENAAVSALRKFARGPLLSGRREAQSVGETLRSLAVKTRSVDTVVSTLSGGNQQKVVMARTLLADPEMVLADEPTQGVDVGARAEIYTILRAVAARGVPVVVASSDAKELEGLCDRVIVMSRGHAVDTLVGDEVTEERMLQSALRSRTHTVRAVGEAQRNPGGAAARLQRFLKGEYAPSVLLVGVIVALAAFILAQNARYLNEFNVGTVLTLAAALGFIALGQTVALLTGGIDLSVGPLAGLLVVIASFFLGADSPVPSMVLGFVAMVGVSLAVGLVNGSLIRFARFTPIAATLAMYIALQGLAFVLRNTPGGYISQDLIAMVNFRIGPLPLSFVLLLVLVAVMEWCLRKTRWGWNLRAAGSSEDAARRVGVNVDRTVLLGYVLTSLLTFLGAIMLMAQIGLGDPAQGVGYTLTAITAVVLGGTSLLGGRGTFVGTLLGSVLLVQVMNATVFLRLDQMWQYVLQGLLILVAAIVFSVARSRKRRFA